MKSINKFTPLGIKELFGITRKNASYIFFVPIFICLIFGLLILIPVSRRLGFWLLEENHPVEILTFIVFISGGVFGIIQTVKLSRIMDNLAVIFYVIFSFFLIIIAMEEVAWGQQFCSFDTPVNWKKINMQGETTLHNLKGMQGNTEILRIIFGFGGLCGIFLRNSFRFKKIGVPLILISWFVIIFFHASIDFLTDFVRFERADRAISRFSEVIELLIACSAFVYLFLNFRMLKRIKM